ncbi:phosphatase PAP2 family protein [Streptomyces sp. NPDC006172]|uniref:phosphatase PAP2 family protein n=1 Tax=Streptomyces sp. NPDC006172 TaxID=3154470 RepID=UPI0033D1C80A
MPTRPHQRADAPAPQATPDRDPGARRPALEFTFLLVLPALLFVLITWQVAVDGPLLGLDGRLSHALVHPDRASELLSALGNVEIAVPALLLVALYAVGRGNAAGLHRWWLPPVTAFVLLTLVALIVVPLKEWTARPGTPVVPPATGYYPSGHTATAGVAYGAAVLLLLPWLATAAARRAAAAVAFVLVLAVSFGLVRRGYHWPLDVAASWCLCVVLLGTLRLVLRRAMGQRRTPERSGTADPAEPAHPHPAPVRIGQALTGPHRPTVDPDTQHTPERKGRTDT